MIRTAWIGGSYEAATRQTITDLPPTAISRRHAEPGMGADVPLLKLIQAMPGASTHALLERLPGVKKETASRALIKMRSKRLIHSVKIAIAGRKPGNLWYPGPAPVTINHMTVGRPRTVVQPWPQQHLQAH
jgi:hypothetical protein